MHKTFIIITTLFFILSFSDLQAVERVKLQLKWFSSFQFAGYYMAKEKGYYQEVGLDVEIIERNPSISNIEQVVNGNAEYGVADSAILLYRAQGKPLKVLASIFQHSPLVFIAKRESGIVSPFEMKGKTLSYQKGLDDAPLLSMLKTASLGEEDYAYDSLDFSSMELLNNKVDVMSAYLSDQPFFFKEKGIEINIINPLNYGIDFYGDILFTTDNEIKENLHRVKAMKEASIKGWEYAINNIEETIELLQKKYNAKTSIKHLQYEAQTLKELMLVNMIPIGFTDINRFNRIANMYENLGKANNEDLQTALKDLIFTPEIKNKWIEYFYIILGLFLLSILILLTSYFINKRLKSSIDQQKKVQKELRDSKILAESANKSKSEFLANMSHEIRTPMTGMLGFIERLLKDEKDSERLRQLKVIENSGQTLLAIINDILDFSKIESGKLELESFPLNIQELCQNSADMFLSLTSAKNITLHKLINENLPSCIMGDEIRLKQVIFNLMSNAIKFTINGGSISLQVYFNEETQTIYIAVVDTGVGIAKENLEKIFEAFSQEDVSTTRKFGGTGLGLSISSQLVRLMGSEIKVESKVGEGSKFYFEIPVEICTHESDLIRVDTSEDLTKSRIFNGHILVVEDNKTNQMLMSMILDDLNLTYDIANNGAEATLNFKLKKYDLILMDENMPIMNGIEATKNIRERELDESLTPTPIIAVTANALRGDKEKFIDSGMDDYIPKPYSEDDIVRVLQKYLG